MFRQLKPRLKLTPGNTWPFVLGIIAIPYFVLPRTFWLSTTYILVGATFLIYVWFALVDWFMVQKKLSTLLFAGAFLCFGVGFVLSSLWAAPNSLFDLTRIRSTSRILFFIGLPILALAVYQYAWYVEILRRNRSN